MNALLLSALLLLSNAPTDLPPTLEAGQEELAPPCNPPLVGDWWIASDCLLVGQHTVTGNVFLVSTSSLELAPGAGLDLDLGSRHLWIGVGSKVLIGQGARIH